MAAARQGGLGLYLRLYPHRHAQDRHNENKKLRNVLDRAGFEWAIPHSFRRTVATLIDQAGLGVTEAAAVLSQHPHTTSRYCFGKRGDTSRAASVL